MQQRGVNSMDLEPEDQMLPQPSRGRNNSKLKVLVRSHAMREETSPPRDPAHTALSCSPTIKLTPSIDSPASPLPVATANSPPLKPVLVLSPSGSRGTSPSSSSSPHQHQHHRHTPPSPHHCHAHHHGHAYQTEFTEAECSAPKAVAKMNRQNLEQQPQQQQRNGNRAAGGICCKGNVILEESSHNKINRNEPCDCHNNNNSSSVCNNNTLTVSRSGGNRNKLRHQSSSQGSFEGSASSNSPCLSRDNSCEQYTDTTGVDLELFIPETLNRNAKDRALMLRIEEELVQLAKDKVKTYYKFPPMSSYQRMLVHRCAAYFGMDHNIESSGKCVVVNKTKCTRIPDVEFRTHIKEDLVFGEEQPPRRSILKRDSNSIEDYSSFSKSPDRSMAESRRSKSFEEREEEYEKARRRIFNKELQSCGGSADDIRWDDIAWAETENFCRFRSHRTVKPSARLLKVQSEETGDDALRPHVAKSYSFGGYGGGGGAGLVRGDSLLSTHSAGPRLLTKQDSGASSVSWRLSPSSSGYKTQSQRSESFTPSPTSTPYLSGDSSARQDSTNSTATTDSHQDDGSAGDGQVIWAVTNISSVPKGSVIINPQTGQSMKNMDGSVYHFDPDNPPPSLPHPHLHSAKPPPSPTAKRPPSPKKRPIRTSPIKKMNSSTSPSLPFTPPPSSSRPSAPFTTTCLPLGESPINPPPFMYPTSYTPDGNGMQIYQPQCIVFAPYGSGVPLPYDGRLETQDVAGYYNIPENSNNPPTYQPAAPPPPPLWNQQPQPYYQTPPQARFAVPQQSPFVPSYPPNYIQQNAPPPPHDVYSHQALSIVYQPTNMYPNHQNMVYPPPQQPLYPTTVFHSQNQPYPPNTPTPNSCTSSVSGSTTFYDPNLGQVVQSMSHLAIGSRGGKYPKPVCSSGSSTDASSAVTVVAPPNPYDTPPLAGTPMLYRQMSNVVTSRASRSPTPAASDAHMDTRQRLPLVYPHHHQGVAYPMHVDNRIVPGRGQPSAYRHTPIRQQQQQVADIKSFKNRRPR